MLLKVCTFGQEHPLPSRTQVRFAPHACSHNLTASTSPSPCLSVGMKTLADYVNWRVKEPPAETNTWRPPTIPVLYDKPQLDLVSPLDTHPIINRVLRNPRLPGASMMLACKNARVGCKPGAVFLIAMKCVIADALPRCVTRSPSVVPHLGQPDVSVLRRRVERRDDHLHLHMQAAGAQGGRGPGQVRSR